MSHTKTRVKNNIIWFDLDGTLIDASDRMYNLFQVLVPTSKLSKNEYWNLKRNNYNHKRILVEFFPEYDYNLFEFKWMELIESEQFIATDKLYPNVLDMLKLICMDYVIILLTARQSKDVLYQELERLEVKKYFDHIFATEGKKEKRELTEAYYKDTCLKPSSKDCFVSDIGKDIATGNILGCNTIGVTYGFMSKECIQKYEPAFTVSSVAELKKLLSKKQL